MHVLIFFITGPPIIRDAQFRVWLQGWLDVRQKPLLAPEEGEEKEGAEKEGEE